MLPLPSSPSQLYPEITSTMRYPIESIIIFILYVVALILAPIHSFRTEKNNGTMWAEDVRLDFYSRMSSRDRARPYKVHICRGKEVLSKDTLKSVLLDLSLSSCSHHRTSYCQEDLPWKWRRVWKMVKSCSLTLVRLALSFLGTQRYFHSCLRHLTLLVATNGNAYHDVGQPAVLRSILLRYLPAFPSSQISRPNPTLDSHLRQASVLRFPPKHRIPLRLSQR